MIKMNDFGFIKIASAVPKLRVADVGYNVDEIICAMEAAAENGAQVLLTPELSVCGYTCEDLLFQNALTDACLAGVERICECSKRLSSAVIIGVPLRCMGGLYNTAMVIKRGKVLGIVPKTYLANSGEFCEKRWFRSGDSTLDTVELFGYDVPFGNIIFKVNDDCAFGIEICEDLWSVTPPGNLLALNGANIIFNLSASDECVSKNDFRREMLAVQSEKLICAYAYASAGVCESTTDLVFGGSSFIFEKGKLLAEGNRFSFDTEIIYADVDLQKLNTQRIANGTFSDAAQSCIKSCMTVDCRIDGINPEYFTRKYSKTPFVPDDETVLQNRCEEILNIQSCGLAKRLMHTNSKRTVVGISGGLDSTLALLVAVRAANKLGLPNDSVIGITMPGFGTTDRTYTNALALMNSLGVTVREISIKNAVMHHLEDIGHDINVHDVTYENAQARERTQILMDVANKENALLVGTGDLSESALGWCTYGGDHMSMYGVNAGVPKTLIRHIVRYVAENSKDDTRAILFDVLDTPVSPELLPPDEKGNIAQKTEDNLGPYILHDFFLYHFVHCGAEPKKIEFLALRTFEDEFSKEEITKCLKLFLKRFFASQFKRSCTPDAPKVGSVGLSPRGDFIMPSDAVSKLWTDELD